MLKRNVDEGMIAGVCAGLADWTEEKGLRIETPIIRIAFVLLCIFGFSLTFWIYLLLWIVMPKN